MFENARKGNEVITCMGDRIVKPQQIEHLRQVLLEDLNNN